MRESTSTPQFPRRPCIDWDFWRTRACSGFGMSLHEIANVCLTFLSGRLATEISILWELWRQSLYTRQVSAPNRRGVQLNSNVLDVRVRCRSRGQWVSWLFTAILLRSGFAKCTPMCAVFIFIILLTFLESGFASTFHVKPNFFQWVLSGAFRASPEIVFVRSTQKWSDIKKVG